MEMTRRRAVGKCLNFFAGGFLGIKLAVPVHASCVDDLGNICDRKIRVHIKAVEDSLLPTDSLIKATQEVFGPAGFKVEIGSQESLNRPELRDIAINGELEGGITPDQEALFKNRNNVGPNEMAIYIVNSLVPATFRGVASYPDGKPGAIIVTGALPYILPHEIGHVMGLGHAQGSDQVMFVGPHTRLPPIFKANEIDKMKSSLLALSC
jgi:hypothetical protein